MPISFKSKLSSIIANATFFDKTIDDETIGQLGLNNPDTANHGSQVVSAQKDININKRISTTNNSLTASDQITLDIISKDQTYRIEGASVPISLNSLPFGTVIVPLDNTIVILMGTSDSKAVTVTKNDNDYGCMLFGDATLLKGYRLRLAWDDVLKRYYEDGRNF